MTTDPILEAPTIIDVLVKCEQPFYPDLEQALSPRSQRTFERLVASGEICEMPESSPRRYHITAQGRRMLTMLLHARESRRNFRERRRRSQI